jgi:hypothetical protein
MTRFIAPFPNIVLAPFTECIQNGMVGPVFQEGIAHAIEAGLPLGRTAAAVVVFQVIYVYHINTTYNPASYTEGPMK